MKTLRMFLMLTSLTAGPLWAISSQITFQGTLKQSGVPVNTNKNMQFSFVDGTGATIPGTVPIAVANIQVTNGLFAVQLPIDPTINWQAYQPYIQVSVEGQILSPNQPLTSNLYSIVSQSVIDSAIVTAKLADTAVTTAKMSDQAVTTAKIAAGAVTTAQIAMGAVSSAQMATGAVTYGNLDSATVQPYLVPQNAIVMFPGACPTGWQVYGPLQGNFPVGAGGALNFSPGQSGGAATHTHTTPDHQHPLATSGPINAGCYAGPVGISQGGSLALTAIPSGNYCGYTGIQAITTVGGGGVTGSASSLPPYQAVVFCQKL